MTKWTEHAPCIQAVLFDKDGTLFDFDASWSAWARRLLTGLAGGDGPRLQALAASIGFDLDARAFRADSPVIAGTPDDVAHAMLPYLTGVSFGDLKDKVNSEAAQVPLVEAVPLRPLMQDLRARGLRIGLATNDAEVPARAHLQAAGITGFFDFIAGSDSGYGGKPEPGQLLAFCAAIAARPQHVAMIGDSLHDLHAARAAGMVALGVLSGPARRADLCGAADAILPDIGHVPAWLDSRRG